MAEKTPQIETILDELAHVTAEAVQTSVLDEDRVEELTKSLATNGWERHSRGEDPLSSQLEDRVHRVTELRTTDHRAILGKALEKIQERYNRHAGQAPPASPVDR